jgi:8-hydroxy-5-deazaflavin:NADPH oxidoreductase
MKVTVVGAGRIGGNVARLLAQAGHEVTVTFSRDASALEQRAAEFGATAVTDVAAAVAAADVVVLSVPWGAIPAALERTGSLAGKVVIDTTNQFGPGPHPAAGQTAAAYNAARMPGARYTKSFNTLTSGFQARTAHHEPRVAQWVCGDDAEARRIACDLVRDAGYDPVDLGATATCAVMEAPRRPGAVYGEEYRRPEADEVVAAVAAGQPIPPTPEYGT